MADGDRPGGEERPLWVLTRDEQRLLWITFAGGFASIVAGAACIGVAISLARASHYVRPDTRLEILLLAPVSELSMALPATPGRVVPAGPHALREGVPRLPPNRL